MERARTMKANPWKFVSPLVRYCSTSQVLLFLTTAALTFFSSVALAQTSKSISPDSPERRIEDLIYSVAELQIEYRADIQLNAMESNKLTNRKLAEETLLMLFDDARLAKYPYKLSITKYPDPATRDVEIVSALSYLSLDALSIRTRVVRDLVARNSAKALQEFQSIHLAIPPTTCKSMLIPEVSEYYALLTSIGNSTLGSGTKARDDFLHWTAGEVGEMSSALQLAPMALSLSNLNLTPNEFKILADAYLSRLQDLAATDRELTAIQADQSLITAIRQLATHSREESWPVAPILQSYRRFLIRSARQSVCTDASTEWNGVTGEFNKLMDEFKVDAIEKLDPRHIERSTESGGVAEVEVVPSSERLWRGLTRLIARRGIEQRGGKSR